MGARAASEGDLVVATDTHVVMVPSPAGPAPTPTAMPFRGALGEGLSETVRYDERRAATDGSGARNEPAHVAPVGAFQRPPSNRATVRVASRTVKVDDRPAARHGDAADTCNDPSDAPAGSVVVASSTVVIGD